MFDDRRRAPRLFLLAAIGAAHLALVLLLLSPTVRGTPSPPEPALALFDVTPPVEPPPPLPPPPSTAPGDISSSGGGSPGVRRQRAAARVDAPAPPMREAMEATLAPLPLGPLPALPAGTAMLDLGAGGANGEGTGSGSGNGLGTGDGQGSGGVSDALGRAEWVKRPPDEAFRRNWPLGRSRLPQAVVVVLSCSVRRSGVPYRCRLRSESLRGGGFARTAIMVMPEARVRPMARNGSVLWDTPVLVTIIFDAIEVTPRVSGAASAPLAR